MKRNNIDPNTLLDRAVEAIRDEAVDQSVVDAAAARVRESLSTRASAEPVAAAASVTHIRGCDDVQALIPSYLAGGVADARKLLFEDHMRECVPCRKALKAARTGESPAARPAHVSKAAPRPRRTAPVRWAIAAGLVAAFAVLPVAKYLGPFGGSLATVVEAADGPVYEVEGVSTRQLAAGDTLAAGERLRTARDAGAVLRLDNGVRVELRERSELAIAESGSGATIRLDRGNVIVTAPASAGRIYVATPASLVTVEGSTVAVTSGTKGTRVSTVEGRAQVDSAGVYRLIGPGEQFASSPSIEPVSVARDVSWSRDASKYSEALAALRTEIDATALAGELRTSTRLLDLAPEGTVFYAAIPNISAGLAEASDLLQRRLSENPALAEWWQQEHSANHRAGLDLAVQTIRELGAFIGPEIAVAVSLDRSGGPGAPLVLAELKDAAGFRAALERHLGAVGEASKIQVVESVASAKTGAADGLTIVAGGDLLAISPSLDLLAGVTGGAHGFTSSPFYTRLADEYRDGVAFLLAADLERIVAAPGFKKDAKETDALDRLGVTGLRYFVVKQRMDGTTSNASATLTFDGQRRGIASWLAAPGPVGALQYISPDANVVAAFVVEQPAALVDDMLGFIGSDDPEGLAELRRFETENNVSFRDDVAASLGGEFAFAVDGPVLPTPSWKMVFEVNDATRLQTAFERFVDAANREAAAAGRPTLAISRAEDGGRTYFTLATPETSMEVVYTFTDGYMIAAPSRVLVDRAIRYRESGYTILTAPRFTAALPADGQTSFSALVYQDLTPLLEKVPGTGLPDTSMLPTLAYAYAREDRIEFGANGKGAPLGLSPATLLGVPGSGGLKDLMKQAVKG